MHAVAPAADSQSPAHAQPVDRTPVYGVDLLRFAAAALIVLYHLKPRTWGGEANAGGRILHMAPDAPMPNAWAWWGFIGVQVFFVISGLVIGFSARHATARGFVISRVTRLWPAMLICASIVAAFNIAFWGHHPGAELAPYLRAVLFWPMGPWVTQQIWTLGIEVAFYLLVWAIVAAGRAARLDWLAWALAIASGTFWLAWLGGLVQPGRMESLLLLRHGCYFGLGMALMKAGAGPFGWRQGALVALCCATAWVEISALLDAEFPPDRDAFPVIVPFSAWLGAVGLIWLSVRWKMQAAHALARQGRWLAHAVRWLGLATYPLYLIHVQPGVLVMRLVMDRGVAASPAAWIAAAACTALALLIAIVFEPRVRRPVRKVAESLLLHMPQRRWRPANSG